MSTAMPCPAGFLLGPCPRGVLPPPFVALEELVRGAPHESTKFLAAIKRLPDLTSDLALLGAPLEKERGAAVYSFLAHTFLCMTRGTGVPLPANLARPWAALSDSLGRPPVITYAASVLSNFTWKDPAAGVGVENVDVLSTFTGTADEAWFYAIHVAVEAAGAEALAAFPRAMSGVASDDAPMVAAALLDVKTSVEAMNDIMRRLPERCSPAVFFHDIRPFLGSLKGVVYEGVEKWREEAQSFAGASGAQSTLIPCLDAFLGVEHTSPELIDILRDMRRYMPTSHRAALESVEAQGPRLRSFVQGLEGTSPARARYSACVEALVEFRGIHRAFASRFISAKARNKAPAEMEGTGGTSFVRYLTNHLEDTRRALLPEASRFLHLDCWVLLAFLVLLLTGVLQRFIAA